MAAEVADDLALDQSPRRIGLLHFGQRRIGDESAAIAMQRDDAGKAEAPEGLANERAPGPELLREMRLAEFLSGPVALGDDQRRDGVRHRVIRGEAVEQAAEAELARFARRRRGDRLRAAPDRLPRAAQNLEDRLGGQRDAVAAPELALQSMHAEILGLPQFEDQRLLAREHLPVRRRRRPAARVDEALGPRLLISPPPFAQGWARNAEPRANQPPALPVAL